MPPPLHADADEPDDDLMAAFAAGRVGAFDLLYQRHSAALYRFVRRLLGQACAPQVDEVFQESWLKVVQQRLAWSPQGASFRTWLFTLAHNRAIDCLRKSGREVTLPEGDEGAWEPAGGAAWAGWPAAPEAGSEERVFWRAAGQRLLECLDGLPAAQRAVFLLHHEEDMQVHELAQVLDLGFETAKSRLRYAMGKLRTCMGAYLPTPLERAAASPTASAQELAS